MWPFKKNEEPENNKENEDMGNRNKKNSISEIRRKIRKNLIPSLKKLKNESSIESGLQSIESTLSNIEKDLEKNQSSEDLFKAAEIKEIKTELAKLDISHQKVKDVKARICKIFKIEIEDVQNDDSTNTKSVNNNSESSNIKKDVENSELKKMLTSIQDDYLLKQGQNIADIAVSTDKIDKIESQVLKLESELLNPLKKSTNFFWSTLKSSIPKVNLYEVFEKITSAKNDLSKDVKNSKIELKTSLNSISFSISSSKSSLSNEIAELKKELIELKKSRPKDYLKYEDFKFELKTKFKELDGLKEVGEELEALPTKLQNIESKLTDLDAKLENMPNSSSSQISTDVPKEEKSIIELAQYMRDGLAQFENISRLYVSKKDDIKNLGKLKNEHSKEVENTKKTSMSEGESKGRIATAKEIAGKFPTEFNSIKSMFSDILEEKFSVDDTLEITNENKNELMPFINNEVNLGMYKVLKQALLLDNEIIFKAEIEEVIKKEKQEEKVIENNDSDLSSTPDTKEDDKKDNSSCDNTGVENSQIEAEGTNG